MTDKPIRYRLAEGEAIPPGYGIAYIEWDYTICYPIPFNWLVGWWRKVGHRLSRGSRPTEAEREIRKRIADARREGFEHGWMAGKEQSEIQAGRGVLLKELESLRDEFVARLEGDT